MLQFWHAKNLRGASSSLISARAQDPSSDTRFWGVRLVIVDWRFQREVAESAVENLLGVKGVNNTVSVRPKPIHAEVQSWIEAALKRNAAIESQHISVSVLGHKVILSGETDSVVKKIAAERAAWQAPGVDWVENLITVSPGSRTVTAA